MPGREVKVKLIEDHLLNSGSANLSVLDRALARELPPHVHSRTAQLAAFCRSSNR
jgi:hypothetical protein